jgi:hypothetical protein
VRDAFDDIDFDSEDAMPKVTPDQKFGQISGFGQIHPRIPGGGFTDPPPEKFDPMDPALAEFLKGVKVGEDPDFGKNMGWVINEGEEKKAKAEVEKKAKEDEEKKAKAEVEKKAKEDEEKKAKAEAEKKAKAEVEKKAKEDEEKKAKEEEKSWIGKVSDWLHRGQCTNTLNRDITVCIDGRAVILRPGEKTPAGADCDGVIHSDGSATKLWGASGVKTNETPDWVRSHWPGCFPG